MKRCFKCSEVLPLSEFYKHPMMGDGLLGKCKKCARRDVRVNRERRLSKYQEYDRSRYANDPLRGVAAHIASLRRDPVKKEALRMVHNELASGRMQRGPCAVCGVPKTDAHHPDYNEPLDVMWLCRKHHMAQHRKDVEDRPFPAVLNPEDQRESA